MGFTSNDYSMFGDRSINPLVILQTYSLSEILEYNDVSEEEALTFMVEQGIIVLPNPKPIDI